MDRTRKANREAHEATFQYKSPREALLDEALNEDKLAQLQAFIAAMEQTSAGAVELQRRAKLFGICDRKDIATSAEYYHNLHHWLHRDIPQTKLPLHAPRQE